MDSIKKFNVEHVKYVIYPLIDSYLFLIIIYILHKKSRSEAFGPAWEK